MRLLPLLLGLLLSPAASAELPLPDYGQALGIRAWHRVNGHLERGVRLRTEAAPHRDPARVAELEREADAAFHTALDEIHAFRTTVRDTSGLAYLEGLAWRLLHDPAKAEAAFRHSIELDPDGAVDAWHDLGELLMTREAWPEADRCFAEVTEHLDTGPHAWRGPLRQSEVAAWQGDAEGMERHLQEALRRGFRMDYIRGEPQWRQFYADPRTRGVVEKMVTVYGDQSLLDALR